MLETAPTILLPRGTGYADAEIQVYWQLLAVTGSGKLPGATGWPTEVGIQNLSQLLGLPGATKLPGATGQHRRCWNPGLLAAVGTTWAWAAPENLRSESTS